MNRFAAQLTGRDAPRLAAQMEPEMHDGCAVFYRGYIANRPALLGQARKRGETLAGFSSAALFARAYRWWGEELPSHVLGEYAVAVFDPRAARLLLAHDSLGNVPLFYFESADTFAFASHLEDLVPLAGTDDLDEEYLADFLTKAQSATEHTPYRRIRRLIPGHSLVRTNRQTVSRRTWDIARIEPMILGDEEEYAERFRTLLAEAVTAALQCEGKVWCELSGGLDSSTLFSLAAGSAEARLEAVSYLASSSRTGDEREWMKAALAGHSLPWHTLDVDESRPFSELPEHFFAEPCCTLIGAGVLKRYMALADSHDVRVILSGVGGDQVCGGDHPKPFHLADLLPWHFAGLPRALRAWRANDGAERPLMYLFLTNVLCPTIRYWTHRCLFVTKTGRLPEWIEPDFRRRMRLDQRTTASPISRCRCIGQQFHAERIGSVAFAPTFAWEPNAARIEIRKPYLYRPLVEFVLAVPPEQILRPGQDRVLQRRALKGILPERIRQRRCKASTVEASIEGLRDKSPWTELLLVRPRLVERGYVDGRLWRETVNQARYGQMRSMKHFMAAAVIELWLRQLEETKADVPCTLMVPAAGGRTPVLRSDPV